MVRVPALVVGSVAAVQVPAAELPVALDPVALDPVALDPVALDPVALDPVALDPVAEEAGAEESAEDAGVVADDVVADDAGAALSEPQAATPSRVATDNAAISADERYLAMINSWAAAAAMGGRAMKGTTGVPRRTARAYGVPDPEGAQLVARMDGANHPSDRVSRGIPRGWWLAMPLLRRPEQWHSGGTGAAGFPRGLAGRPQGPGADAPGVDPAGSYSANRDRLIAPPTAITKPSAAIGQCPGRTVSPRASTPTMDGSTVSVAKVTAETGHRADLDGHGEQRYAGHAAQGQCPQGRDQRGPATRG